MLTEQQMQPASRSTCGLAARAAKVVETWPEASAVTDAALTPRSLRGVARPQDNVRPALIGRGGLLLAVVATRAMRPAPPTCSGSVPT